MSHTSAVAIAAVAAPVLRALVHRIEARKDWSPEQKRWIPWVLVALGAAVVGVSVIAGMPIDEAVILGGGAPGAVVVNELMGARKVPPAALLALVALPLAACEASEAVVVDSIAMCVIGVVGSVSVVMGATGHFLRARSRRRYLDSLDARYLDERPIEISQPHADAITYALAERERRRRAGVPPALAIALLMLAPGCALSHQTRAGLAFVAVVPTIEAGVRTYADLRIVEERAIGDDAVKACAGRTDYDACTDAIVKPRRQRLDDARLAIGTYAAAISAAASGEAGDLAGAAQRVLAALAAIGIRVAQGAGH